MAAAVRRVAVASLRSAAEADFRVMPLRWRLGPAYRALTLPENRDPADGRRALAELCRERENLAAVIRAAAHHGFDDLVWQLCAAMWGLHLKLGFHTQWIDTHLLGVEAARRSAAEFGDPRAVGRMLVQLAVGHMGIGRTDEADDALARAVAADRACGHHRGQASAVEARGLLRLRQWRYAEAQRCFEEAREILGRIREGDDGREDVPRATALLEHHIGRAQARQRHFTAAIPRLHEALARFRRLPGGGDPYNAGRVYISPALDLAGPVSVPDVRMQDGGGPVLVGGEFGGEPGQQPGQQIVQVARRAAEEGTRGPGRTDDDQPLARRHTQGPAETVTVGECGEDAVVAGVAREHRGGRGLGAPRPQPLQLLGVREHGGTGQRTPALQQPLRRQPEDRRSVSGASYCIRPRATGPPTRPVSSRVHRRSPPPPPGRTQSPWPAPTAAPATRNNGSTSSSRVAEVTLCTTNSTRRQPARVTHRSASSPTGTRNRNPSSPPVTAQPFSPFGAPSRLPGLRLHASAAAISSPTCGSPASRSTSPCSVRGDCALLSRSRRPRHLA